MKRKTIDDILQIPIINPGEKLYHYTSAEALKGIVNGEFWATERGFLNDVMEFQIATEIFCELLDKHMVDEVKRKELKDKIVKEVNRLQTPSLSSDDDFAYYGDYIISFCQDHDSPLMWSSYSGYAGYCIQFDGQKLIDVLKESVEDYHLFHGEVVYNHDKQLRLLEELVKTSYFDQEQFDYLNTWEDFDNLSQKNLEEFVIFVSVEITAFNAFFKSKHFEGENEYRIVFSIPHDGGRYKPESLWSQYFRVYDEVLIPYVKIPVNKLDSVEKVIIGSKNKSDIAVKGVQYLFRNCKHDIEIEKSAVPLRY